MCSVFPYSLGLGYDEGHNPREKRGCYPSRGMGKGQRRKRERIQDATCTRVNPLSIDSKGNEL